MLVRAATAIACLVALAPAAEAATLCVNKPGPQCDQAFTVDQLDDAIVAANANQSDFDLIEIGAGTYDEGPYAVNSFTHVLGAGRDQTILTNLVPGGTEAAVLLLQSPVVGEPRVADITARIGPGSSPKGFQTNGTVERVRVEAAPGSTPGAGINMNGGTLTDAEVILPLEEFSTGASLSNTDVTNSSFQAAFALFMQNGTARNVRLVGGNTGLSIGFGPNRLEDALIQVSGENAVGVRRSGFSGGQLSLSHVTMVGDGGPGSVGIEAIGSNGAFAAQTADTTVRNVLATGFERAAVRQGHEGAGPSACGTDCRITQNLTVEYSVLGSAPVDLGGPGVSTTGPDVVAGMDPRLADRAAGDFRLRHDSPAVDGGDPVGLGGSPFYSNEPGTDLGGGLRIVNGRRDAGAFEYQRGAPSAQVGVPESVLLYRPATFTAAGTDPDPFDPLSFRFLVDGLDAGTGPSITRAFTTLGTHRVEVTASDPAGIAGLASAEFEVEALDGRCANRRGGSRTRDAFTGTGAGERLVGGRGNDLLRGGGGADCLSGGSGKDRLVGGRGKDRVAGGSGNDVILVRDGARDIVNCGGGKADRVRADRRDRVRRCERP